MGIQRGVACLAMLLCAGQLTACASKASLPVADVPGLDSQTDQLRVGYCAERERDERLRYEMQRAQGGHLLGLGLLLTAGATSLLVAGHETDSQARKHTLYTLTGAGYVGGVFSLGAGGVLLATNEHDDRAARAAIAATNILGARENAKDDKGDDENDAKLEKQARRWFADCLEAPQEDERTTSKSMAQHEAGKTDAEEPAAKSEVSVGAAAATPAVAPAPAPAVAPAPAKTGAK